MSNVILFISSVNSIEVKSPLLVRQLILFAMTEAIFTLSDDRKLSYAVYGPDDGQPVLYFHGTPSSRREILLLKSFGVDFDSLLQQSGLKLIVPDRGALTTFHPQRTFLSFASDAVELLQHLGVSQCATLCWSGGGPYSLAAAYRFPNLITSVYILCGITKPFDKEVLKQMGLNKYYFLSARYTPLLLQMSLNILRQQKTTTLPNRKFTGLPYVDYRLLQKATKEIADLTLKESIRKGTRSAVHEAGMYFSNYSFAVNDIQQPIHYWWGTLDMNVVELHAREVEQNALHPVMHYREGEGHLSLYVKCFGEALQAIAQAFYERK
jgi:pimeloyl-ACP methyl ester carboxylesterase